MPRRKKLGRIAELSEIAAPAPDSEPDSGPAPEGPELQQDWPRSPDAGPQSEDEARSEDSPPSRENASSQTAAERAERRLEEEGDRRPPLVRIPGRILVQLEQEARRDNLPLNEVVVRALAAAGYGGRRKRRIRRRYAGRVSLAEAALLSVFLRR